MSRKSLIIISFITIALPAGYVMFARDNSEHIQVAGDMVANASVVSNIDQQYTNSKYRFSLMLPRGFSAREIADPDGGTDVVVFESSNGEGIQVTVSPFGGAVSITPEMIKKDLPDMAVKDAQVIEVGNKGTGTAFISDNPEFGGSSREVWFVFKGNLYQISTYSRLDELLKSIFSTWKFE